MYVCILRLLKLLLWEIERAETRQHTDQIKMYMYTTTGTVAVRNREKGIQHTTNKNIFINSFSHSSSLHNQ